MKNEQINENYEIAKATGEKLELYTEGNAYKCPHCDAVHTLSDYESSEHENEDGATVYACPNCGEDVDDYELEAVSVYDFFGDIFDTKYIINDNLELIGVKYCVAFGGPNVYIDTYEGAAVCYWGLQKGVYDLSSATIDAVNNMAEEFFTYQLEAKAHRRNY